MRSVVLYPVPLLPPKKNNRSTATLFVWCALHKTHFDMEGFENFVIEFLDQQPCRRTPTFEPEGWDLRPAFLGYFQLIKNGLRGRTESEVARLILKIGFFCIEWLSKLEWLPSEDYIVIRAIVEDTNVEEARNVAAKIRKQRQLHTTGDSQYSNQLKTFIEAMKLDGKDPNEVPTGYFGKVMYDCWKGRVAIKDADAALVLVVLISSVTELRACLASPPQAPDFLRILKDLAGRPAKYELAMKTLRTRYWNCKANSSSQGLQNESTESTESSVSSSLPQNSGVLPVDVEQGALYEYWKGMKKFLELSDCHEAGDLDAFRCQKVVDHFIVPYFYCMDKEACERFISLDYITNKILGELSKKKLPTKPEDMKSLLETTFYVLSSIKVQCDQIIKSTPSNISKVYAHEVSIIATGAEQWLKEKSHTPVTGVEDMVKNVELDRTLTVKKRMEAIKTGMERIIKTRKEEEILTRRKEELRLEEMKSLTEGIDLADTQIADVQEKIAIVEKQIGKLRAQRVNPVDIDLLRNQWGTLGVERGSLIEELKKLVARREKPRNGAPTPPSNPKRGL